MRRFVALLAIATTAACGRSELFEAPVQGVDPVDVTTTPSPLAIHVRTADPCPARGSEADMRPQSGDHLVVASLLLVGECSGAGGHWIIGRVPSEGRDIMFGEHACYFLGDDVQEGVPRPEVGVARIRQTAALFQGPVGWCIHDADGNEPVQSDVIVQAVALFASEVEARAAVQAWSN